MFVSLTCLDVGILNSALHYWEVRHGDIVKGVLKTIFKILNLIEYDYSVIDSTKNTDQLKKLHELFIYVRVRSGGMLFPVYARLTDFMSEFVRGTPKGHTW